MSNPRIVSLGVDGKVAVLWIDRGLKSGKLDRIEIESAGQQADMIRLLALALRRGAEAA